MQHITKLKSGTIEQEIERLEALLGSIGAGIVATDEAGYVTRINKAALQLLGYRAVEVLGKRFIDTFMAHREDGSQVRTVDRPIVRSFLTGETISEKALYGKKDGSLLPVQLTVSPIMMHGRPVGAIEVFRDATLDIQSDKMKSDFISLASHQLRTPLSSINIYSHMLQDGQAGKLNMEQKQFVDRILMSVDRMNELINTLLNITRIEAGGITVETGEVQLGRLVSELVSEAVASAEEKGLNLSSEIDHTIPCVTTDDLLVREVMANLISNAIKYTPAGGSVVVSLNRKRNEVIFSVRDTGYGIPPDAQKRIFTKFFRADNASRYDASGTGLGLYMTKNIAEALDGELWFKSTEHKGSTFYFSLPLHGSLPKSGRFKPGV